jgi:serine/threonine-protein kinase
MILERDPPRLRDIAPEVPAGLEDVIRKCLTKNRDDRYQSVGDLATGLVAFGSGTWTHAAEEIKRTLARPIDDVNTNRSKPGALISVREVDVQPTASTVVGKRKFPVANEPSKTPFWIAGGIGLCIALALVMVIQRKRAQAAREEAATAPTEMVGVPINPGTEVQLPAAQAPLAQTGQPQGVPAPLVQQGDVVDLDLSDAGGHVAASAPTPAPQPVAQSTPAAVRKVKAPAAPSKPAVGNGGSQPRGGAPSPAGGSLPDVLRDQK